MAEITEEVTSALHLLICIITYGYMLSYMVRYSKLVLHLAWLGQAKAELLF